KCDPFTPDCEKGSERVLIKKAVGEPGNCCDRFECKQLELRCENVQCPDVIDDEGECPEDSFKPPSYVPPGQCCPVYPSCRCQASICAPAHCREGQKVKIIRKGDGTPGRCCDDIECESGDEDQNADAKKCPHGGKTHENGEIWQSSSCKQCKCKEGIALCSEMSCPNPPPDCTWVEVPEGECCPVCMGCEADGIKRKRNETWQKDDCTSCSCAAEGVHHCQKHMCQVDCDNPKKVPGQCCPVCDAPLFMANPLTCPAMEHCPLRCEYGLLRDAQGCFQCACAPMIRPTAPNCSELTETTCDKFCPHGYDRDGRGCATCKCAKCPPLHQCYKHCLYGFESNVYGCPICKCRVIDRNETTYQTQLRKDRKGSDVCYTSSPETGQLERDSGEWWSDGCRNCFCDQKHEYCSLITCPPKNESCPDDQWKKIDGWSVKNAFAETFNVSSACCETCLSQPTRVPVKHEHTVCQSAGRLYVDGETWEVTPCTSCTCRIGHVLCRTVECPALLCEHPIINNSDSCCQKYWFNGIFCVYFINLAVVENLYMQEVFKCPEEEGAKTAIIPNNNILCKDETGLAHLVGSSWRVDECVSCRCTVSAENEGKIECFKEKCPPLKDCFGIPLTIKGRCCSICSDLLSTTSICKYSNTAYALNEQWKDGDCRNCSCERSGQVVCKEQQCAPCKNPVYVSGQCCPTCKDNSWGIMYTNGPAVTGREENSSSLSTESSAVIYGFCFAGFLLLAVFATILLYKLFKRSQNNHHKKSPIQFNNSSVLLSSSKAIGSTPRLFEDFNKRRDSCGDGQSESLLSTTSESSSAPSSNCSSGQDQHSDTSPLTTKQSTGQAKSADRLGRGFGSFKNPLSKSGDVVGSHM
ncbi:unnamed protein product, partial [Enterobius vermicularis]|uniref:VWFC domain-containing protein n=1 Tax=Enterobius vermicularis TaxID=51028 RepID=A0A0N4VBE4_ENTVE